MHRQEQMPNSQDMKRNRLLAVVEGCTARSIFNLTSGAFLVGLLKYLGASDTVCGYILTIPVLAGIIQIFAPTVLEKLQWRKPISIFGATLHRVMLSLMIVLAIIPIPTQIRLWIIGLFYLLSFSAVSFVTPAISNMYISFVEPASRGRYFGTRERWLLFVSTAINLVMGKLLDIFKDNGQELYGHVAIYIMVFLFTIINTWSFLGMKEVPLHHSLDVISLKEILILPLKNHTFRLFFILSLLWNISIQIAVAYFGVYQVSDLSLTYTQINLLSTITSVSYFFTARPWGHLADKVNWSFTTMLAVATLGFTHILWFFVCKGPLMIPIMVVAFTAAGIGWSGINVSLFNLQYDYIPQEKRTVYIGFNAAISGVAGYAASLFGAFLVGLFGNWSVSVPFSIGIKQVLFLVSGLLLTVGALYIRFYMMPRKAALKE